MKKLIFSISILIFLFGCQSQSISNENNLKQDAQDVYSIIKNKELNTSSLSSDEREKINDFKTTYIDHYKQYNNQQLISNIENLINSYDLYYVAIGKQNSDAESMYKNRLEKTIEDLNKEFNK
jgi:RNase H-fold protein (predicted Holliday junction resolvase)